MIWYTRLLPLCLMAIAAIVGLVFLKKQSIELRIVTLVCCLNFIFDLLGNVLGFYNINNHWLYNIADFIRTELWLYFFYLFYIQQGFKKYVLYFMLVFPIVFIVVQFFQPIHVLQSISYISGGILIIACCFVYYGYEFLKENTYNLFKTPYFWLCSGLLIYYALNVPFLGLLPWLLKHTSKFVKYYFYICVLGSSFLLSIFKIKAFLCIRSKN